MRGARYRMRQLAALVQHAFHRWVALALVLISLRRWDAVAVGGSVIIALTVQQGDISADTTGNGSGGFFFPLSEALTSVMRLAVDDINAGGVTSLTEGNLSLSVVELKTGGIRAMEGLCDALEVIGENGTFGVSEACILLARMPKVCFLFVADNVVVYLAKCK